MVNNQSHDLDAVFHALSDPTRRTMIQRLAKKDQRVSDLAKPFDMSLAAASKHIRVLERAKLIQRTIQGRTHICRLNPWTLSKIQEWLRYYERFWTEKLDALETLLTEEDKKQKK